MTGKPFHEATIAITTRYFHAPITRNTKIRAPQKSAPYLPIQVLEDLQSIADMLREKGAGYHADLLNTANPTALTAIAKEIESGGYHEEAAEVRKVVSELLATH